MRQRVAIVYNHPVASRYDTAGEEKAVLGVLEAVKAVRSSLLELGYEVSCLPLTPPVELVKKALGSLDVALTFNLFEGFPGQPETEAVVPATLAELGIPFTGCPAAALEMCLDKTKVKRLLKAAGILTPDFQLLNPESLPDFRLGYPCIVKPAAEDASHGISETSLVSDRQALLAELRRLSGCYGEVLVEEFIDGREFNATVIGNSGGAVLPVSEIVFALPPDKPRILTFDAKWQPDSLYFKATRAVCPAEIGADERESIMRVALAAYRLLGCRGYARVDMRMDTGGRPNVIEVNPNPDISPGAGAARQAAAAGMNYTQFINKIVRLAPENNYRENQDTPSAGKRQASRNADTPEYTGIQAV